MAKTIVKVKGRRPHEGQPKNRCNNCGRKMPCMACHAKKLLQRPNFFEDLLWLEGETQKDNTEARILVYFTGSHKDMTYLMQLAKAALPSWRFVTSDPNYVGPQSWARMEHGDPGGPVFRQYNLSLTQGLTVDSSVIFPVYIERDEGDEVVPAHDWVPCLQDHFNEPYGRQFNVAIKHVQECYACACYNAFAKIAHDECVAGAEFFQDVEVSLDDLSWQDQQLLEISKRSQ